MERRATWVRMCHSWEEEAAADREYWAQYSGDEKVAMIPAMQATFASMRGMPHHERDYRSTLRTLRDRGVRALIAGAHAVAFHAKPRYTDTLEILVDRPAASDDALLFTACADLTFDEAWQHRVQGRLNGEPVDLLCKAHMIRCKQGSADPLDRFDLELLRNF